MGDMPDRLKAHQMHALPEGEAFLCFPMSSGRRGIEYVRADLYDALRAQVEAMRTDISTAHRQIVEGKRACARDTLAAALAKSTGGGDGN